MNSPTFGLSYLEIFWWAQSLVYLLLTLHSFVTGKHWDKSQSHRDVDNGIGWVEFRKRNGRLYLLAFVWVVYITWTVVSACVYGTPPNEHFAHLYEVLASPKRSTTGLVSTYVALALYLAHVTRRLYECLFVSIFSRRQVVGPVSYILDHIYFIAAGLSLIAESPAFVEQDDGFPLSQLSLYHVIAIAVFVYASKIHHNTHSELAKLRRNKSGHIVTTSYKMPQGGWFDKLGVSNPHYLAEIMIYVMIGVVLGMQNCTWWALTAYIVTNQIYRAYHTHQLYMYKFEDYPKDRKMLIPFLF